MITVGIALAVTAYLAGVALALYGLARLADTALFTWTDEDE